MSSFCDLCLQEPLEVRAEEHRLPAQHICWLSSPVTRNLWGRGGLWTVEGKGMRRPLQLPNLPDIGRWLLQSPYHDAPSRGLPQTVLIKKPAQMAAKTGCINYGWEQDGDVRAQQAGQEPPSPYHWLEDATFIPWGFLSHSLPCRITLPCQPWLHGGPAITESMLGRGGQDKRFVNTCFPKEQAGPMSCALLSGKFF